MANYIYNATNITRIENTLSSPTPPDMVRKCEFYLNSCITHMGTITEFCPNIQSYVSSGLTIFGKEQSVYVSDGFSDTYIGMTNNIFKLPLLIAPEVLKEAFKHLKNEKEIDLYINPRGTLVKFVGNKCTSLCAMKRFS